MSLTETRHVPRPAAAPRTLSNDQDPALGRVVRAADFDRALAAFDDGHPEHSATFAAVRWPSRRRECVLVDDGAGRPVAAALVGLVGLPGLPGGLAIVRGGPLWRPRGETPDPARFALALDALVERYVTRGGRLLSVLPPADPEWDEPIRAALTGAGFAPGAAEPFPDRYFVDIAGTPEAIRAAFSSKWRYNLKKAEAAGFTLRRGRDPALLADFMRLYDAMLARKRFNDHSAIATVPTLLAADEEALRPTIFIVDHQGTPCAGAVISSNGDTARFLYGASDDSALAAKPGYFMHWEVIRWLKAESEARWYGLGGTDGFSGLVQFKTGLIGKTGRVVPEPAGHDRWTGAWAHASGRLLYRLRDVKVGLVNAWRLRTGRIADGADA